MTTPASPMYADSARAIPEGNRVPVRTDHSSADTILGALVLVAEDQLVELRALVARASAGESRSSAAVKDSTRGVDIEVKSYADGLLDGAIDDAVSGYARGRRRLDDLKVNGWAETVAAAGPES